MYLPNHRGIKLSTQGSILIAEVRGPWNAECIEEYKRDVDIYARTLASYRPWGVIIDIIDEALCPSHAIKAIREAAFDHAQNYGRACTAYVISPKALGYHLMNDAWKCIYQGIMPFEIFELREDALAWVDDMLQLLAHDTKTTAEGDICLGC